MTRATIVLLALAAVTACRPGFPSRVRLDDVAAGVAASVAASMDGERLLRIERVGRPLVPATAQPGIVDLGLSPRAEAGAWSWPDGRIRVSRTLVDLLDDQELAAALAHELGHLLDGGHLAGEPAALHGSEAEPGPEARADLLGCRLIVAHGLPCQAMARMLRAVDAHRRARAVWVSRPRLGARVAAVESACAALP